jgi:hypothetical protein
MTRSNVPRWTAPGADVPEELGALLRRGRDALGGADEVAELGRRLAMALGPASGLPGSGEPGVRPTQAPALSQNEAARALPRASGVSGAAGLGPSAAWIWGGAFALALVAVGAGVWATQRSPRSLAEPSDGARGVAAGSASPAPSPPLAPAGAEPPTGVGDGAGRSPDAAGTPGGAKAAPNAAPRPARARPSVARSTPARVSRDEAALLRRAQGELAGDPGAALALTREHEARFRHGALVQEREVIAIEALRRLGEPAAASARARAFERRYHGSVHRPRLERGTDTSVPAGAKATTALP